MKHLNFIAVVFVVFTLASYAVLAGQGEDIFQKALQAVLKEPKVKSATWNSRDIPSLLVGVWDDGSNRDGYAQYICLSIAQHGIQGGVVRVMDERAALKGNWRELGKAWCPK